MKYKKLFYIFLNTVNLFVLDYGILLLFEKVSLKSNVVITLFWILNICISIYFLVRSGDDNNQSPISILALLFLSIFPAFVLLFLVFGLIVGNTINVPVIAVGGMILPAIVALIRDFIYMMKQS